MPALYQPIVIRRRDDLYSGGTDPYLTKKSNKATPVTLSPVNLHQQASCRESAMIEIGPQDHNAIMTDISKEAQSIYWASFASLTLYTLALIILVRLQTNTLSLTVRTLLYLVGIHNALSSVVLGFHLKMRVKSKEPESSMDYEHMMRNSLRGIFLFFIVGLSFITAIELFFVAQIIPDIDSVADSFRDTGINMFMNRSLDLVYVFIYFMAIPDVFLIGNELKITYTDWKKK